ncbi:hypothetical protein OX283_007250 [Flavobacterium sp. SUN052]|uniref:hypothetical protein n=1 Tax=Flavobacterium sp. SUN052 TaxID=3002441 RepID=UPI00237EA004|nr:hypothetical protein [Flavobacterium sp. SUN052]MEC4004447.1 hypothetical protein [Flavobacterium sp. SUN052]
MENLKTWKTIKLGLYSFSVNDREIGTLEVVYNNFERKAIFKIEDKIYTLVYNGFWKSTYEIFDESNEVILKSSFEKWYATTTNLDYKGNEYKLKIRNNPLAEFVIFESEKELVSYGLSTNSGKVNVKITTAQNNTDYLLDYLLWYSFLPITQENIGDDFTFQALMSS